MQKLKSEILNSFKSAFYRVAQKDDTIDVKLMVREAMVMWQITAEEAWSYILDLEKSGFIEMEKVAHFPQRYAWMKQSAQLGSAYY